MRRLRTSRQYARRRERDDAQELALLQEFIRCDSVAALAGAIAARLPRAALPETLIAEAGLAGKRPEG